MTEDRTDPTSIFAVGMRVEQLSELGMGMFWTAVILVPLDASVRHLVKSILINFHPLATLAKAARSPMLGDCPPPGFMFTESHLTVDRTGTTDV